MVRTRAMANAARDAHIEAAAYDNLTDTQLGQECKRRLLVPNQRAGMLARLKFDDQQKATLSTSEYAAVFFARSNKLPPYRLWDRAAQIAKIQQKRNYHTRLAAAEKAVTHNNSFKPSLMTLPPEIRNIIYFDLFTSAPGIIQNHRIHPFVLTCDNDDDKRIFFGHDHALLRTCKAIRNDALAVWYGNREYRFTQKRTHLKDHYDNLTLPFEVDETVMAFFERWLSLLGDGMLDMTRYLHLELDYVTFTIKQDVVDVYKTDSLSIKVKDVPAVVKAIWRILGRHMDITKLKASKNVAEYLQKALGIEGTKGTAETKVLLEDYEDLVGLLTRAESDLE